MSEHYEELADELCRQAEALIEMRRHADALPLLQRAIAADPGSYRPWCLSSQALLELGRHAEALEAAEAGTHLNPSYEWPHRLRSIALSNLGREKEALAAAREAVLVDPEGAYPLYQLACREWTNLRRHDARETAAQLLRVAPDDAPTHELLAWFAVESWKFREAEELARRALEIDPECARAFWHLGRALRWQRRSREAIDAHYQAARLRPLDRYLRTDLVQTIQTYLIAGWVAIGLLFLAGLWGIEKLPLSNDGELWASLAWLLLNGIGMYGWHEYRLRELPPEVVKLYRDETWRSFIKPEQQR
ncbi:MAG: repeat-containing protein [Armatimonadetes bacterium]|jgi:tetratricopeptide (TPR) repeat protein|nr:repeat-containing protein [Armatimonadota bacterium]